MADKLLNDFIDGLTYHWYTMNMHPDELTAWRKRHGFTQALLGEILGVKKTTVYRWEKNMRIIPPFLHLALECIEMKGAEFREEAMKKERQIMWE